MAATAERPFFISGGTLPSGASSYVVRQADRDLWDGLRAGDFCYLLDARQRGKSSLMVRAARRLREAGVAVAVLDLTTLGQNLTPEQWYGGLLFDLAEQWDLGERAEEFWLASPHLSPWQRWAQCLQRVLLPACAGPLVVFVDEIDAVRSLPFPTDEFFAGIRALYNRRSEDPDLARLAFCLIGVAAPTDLIRDARTTPFNIGRRIAPDDFSPAEAAPLAAGLGPGGPEMLARALFWTGGHPYLTQRLCQALAQESARTPADVDQTCAALFLTPQARLADDNLAFVRNRLLRGEADPVPLLELYGRVKRGRPVREEPGDPLQSALALSGLVGAQGGRLRVRNRIYARVFDARWVRDSLPGAEVRRQRAAFRRGALRTALAAGLVIALLSLTALSAVRQARRADGQAQTARRYLYVADVNLAQQALADENFGQARQALDEVRPAPGQPDERGWEWRWLWRQCRDGSLAVLQGHTAAVTAVAFAPDGRTLATGGLDTTVRLWDVTARKPLATLHVSPAVSRCLAFSPDGRHLAVGDDHGLLSVLDPVTRRVVAVRRADPSGILSLGFSPGGRQLAVGANGGAVQVWDVQTWRPVAALPRVAAPVFALVFSPNGQTLAVGSEDAKTRLWDAVSWKLKAAFQGGSASWSPDGRRLATIYDDGRIKTVLVYDAATGRRVARLGDYQSYPQAAAFSPDGRAVAVADAHGIVTLWDPVRGQSLAKIHGTEDGIQALAFSPDGRLLATAGGDGSVRLWPAAPRPEVAALPTPGLNSVAFSPDGRLLASANADARVRLWDPATGRRLAVLAGHAKWVNSADFAPDGRTLATASDDGTVRLWDVPTRRTVAVLRHPGVRSAVCARFSPEGQWLAVDEDARALRLWDVRGRREAAPLQGPVGAVPGRREPLECFAWSPDGRLLAGGLAFGSVRLWDFVTRRSVALMPGQSAAVACLAFSPDGRTLASGSDDGTVLLRDIPTRRTIAVLSAHQGGVQQLAWSRDGRTLVAAHQSVMVFWNLATRRPAPLVEHTHWPSSLAFSPDGDTLAIGLARPGVLLWRAAPRNEP